MRQWGEGIYRERLTRGCLWLWSDGGSRCQSLKRRRWRRKAEEVEEGLTWWGLAREVFVCGCLFGSR